MEDDLTPRFVEAMMCIDLGDDPHTTEKTVLCLIDFLSCALAGRRSPEAQRVLELIARWPVPSGVSVIGGGPPTLPSQSAFTNSILAACSSRTDMHGPSTVHPGMVVIPVVLALSSTTKIDGRTFLSAILAGYEAIGRTGRIVASHQFRNRFRSTSVIGAVGAAIAGARVLGLSRAATVNALALSIHVAGGLMEWGNSGKLDLYYQPGEAARTAVDACLLAADGAEASSTILEGKAGFLAAYGGLERAHELLSTPALPEIHAVEFKPVPACVFAQAAAHASERVVLTAPIDPGSIRAVRVRTFEDAIAYPGCNDPGPIASTQAARMSLQYSVAAVLGFGHLKDENYLRRDDAAVSRLVPMIELVADDEFTSCYPRAQGACVDIDLADGSTRTGRVNEVPLFEADRVIARYLGAASTVVGESRALGILEACQSLPLSVEVAPLMRLLTT